MLRPPLQTLSSRSTGKTDERSRALVILARQSASLQGAQYGLRHENEHPAIRGSSRSNLNPNRADGQYLTVLHGDH
jgi:hypothetical protein